MQGEEERDLKRRKGHMVADPDVKVLSGDSHVQEEADGATQLAASSGTANQPLGHVPPATAAASATTVVPRGKNYAKNQRVLKPKRAKRQV